MHILNVAEAAQKQYNARTTDVYNGGPVTVQLRVDQAEIFIREALSTFSWAPVAEATQTEYQLLQAEHPILADIASFRAAHINHLTPRSLDIDAAGAAMAAEGMPVKDRIEDPPRRKWPILLRQTSFLALEERIQFKMRGSGGVESPLVEENAKEVKLVNGSHKARFGEIEERGAAVTPAGRALYDKLLASSMRVVEYRRTSPEAVEAALADTFRVYPDTWEELRKQELVYVKYSLTEKLPSSSLLISELGNPVASQSTIESLIDDGYLETSPITYEDFLPFSAAGIFQSNLNINHESLQLGERDDLSQQPACQADVEGLEHALGCSVIDPDALYTRVQKESLECSLLKLKSLLRASH